jgi:hypothetical protein
MPSSQFEGLIIKHRKNKLKGELLQRLVFDQESNHADPDQSIVYTLSGEYVTAKKASQLFIEFIEVARAAISVDRGLCQRFALNST